MAVPEYVLPWSPGSKTAATSARAQHAPIGIPLPIALASVTTSGLTPASSKPNQRPVRPKPVWISSIIISAPTSSHSSRIAAQVLGGRRIDAALSLDRLDQHRGDRPVDRGPHGVEVAPRDVPEAFRHRLERFVLGRLSGRRQRRRACGRGSCRAR